MVSSSDQIEESSKDIEKKIKLLREGHYYTTKRKMRRGQWENRKQKKKKEKEKRK